MEVRQFSGQRDKDGSTDDMWLAQHLVGDSRDGDLGPLPHASADGGGVHQVAV